MGVVDLSQVRRTLDKTDEIEKRFERTACFRADFRYHVFMPIKEGEMTQGCLYCRFRRRVKK